MSPALVFKVYIWIIDTIASGNLTKEDIDRRWAHSSINEYGEQVFPTRKFHRYKEDIFTLFGIHIRCNRTTGRYFIDSDGEQISWGDARRYITSAFSFQAALDESKGLDGHILFEPIPGGTQYLSTIMRAIRVRKQLFITYHSYDRDSDYDMFFSPYCLKMFKQRWYVVGEASTHPDEIRIYALDRIVGMHMLDSEYSIPQGFSPDAFFDSYYGVFRNADPCQLLIEVTPRAALFLRSLPLHHSQRELTRIEAATYNAMPDMIVFEYHVAPTYDFIQQLRTFGSELRVLVPLSLAKQMQDEAIRLLARYNPDEQDN